MAEITTKIDLVCTKERNLDNATSNEQNAFSEEMVDPPIYNVDDKVPIIPMLFFGFQQLMVSISGLFVEPLLVSMNLCAGNDPLVRVSLAGAIMVGSGIATIAQGVLGVRLPMLQGPSFAFIPALQVFRASYPCPQYSQNGTELISGVSFARMANEDKNGTYVSGTYVQPEWQARMLMLQGSLMIGSCLQIILGASGLVGLVTSHCGPLTIAPLMLLLELSVVDLCLGQVSLSYTGIIMVLVLLLLALYLHDVRVPLPNVKGSIGNGIVLLWVLSWVLTSLGAFKPGDPARTDLKVDVLREANWFQVPYPGQYGNLLTADAGLVLGICAATFASVVESVGDYAAAARTCNQPPPPRHAVNRGILIEGLGCFINATIGGGMSLTTYSENVGVLGITRVCSRRVLIVSGIYFILLGIFTKFGALLAALPDPLVGGLLTVSLAVVGGVGLSSLQLADMRLSRNQAIVGVSIILGMMIPAYIKKSPLYDIEVAGPPSSLGSTVLLALGSLLQIHMFVGGAIAFFLDNSVPGATRKQRGLKPIDVKTSHQKNVTAMAERVYLLPTPLQNFVNRMGPRFGRFVPFLHVEECRNSVGDTGGGMLKL